MGTTPIQVRTQSQADRVAAELRNPSRKFAVVLLFEAPDGGIGSLSPSAVSNLTAGIAKVYVLARASSLRLNEVVVSDLGSVGVAAQVVPPGVSSETDLASDLNFRVDQFESEDDARAWSRWLVSRLAAVSVEQFKVGVDLISFDDASKQAEKNRERVRVTGENARVKGRLKKRDAATAADKERLAEADLPSSETRCKLKTINRHSVEGRRRVSRLGESVRRWFRTGRATLAELLGRREKERLASQLDASNAEINSLKQQLVESQSEAKWLSDEHAKAERALKAAQSRLDKLEPKHEALKQRLRDRGEDPDIRLPDSWSEFSEWCDTHFAGKVMLSRRATREVRNPSFNDVSTAARGVVWLATKYRDFRIQGKGDNLRGPCGAGLSNERCGTDSFPFAWEGGKVRVEWHVKNTNTWNPERCLRIYYFWDATNRQAVIASMPGHV